MLNHLMALIWMFSELNTFERYLLQIFFLLLITLFSSQAHFMKWLFYDSLIFEFFVYFNMKCQTDSET